MAYRISNLPATQITHVISQVIFPAYAKIQDDMPRLKEGYLRVLQVIAFVSFPLAGLIFIFSADFTQIFLGAKWMPMVTTMQVLCFFGLIRSLTATMGTVFVGVGRPKILAQLSFIQLIILMLIIYPLTKRWGILGTAFATLIPNFVTPVLASIKLIKIIKCKTAEFLRVIILPFFFTALTVVAAFYLNIYVTGLQNIFCFIIKVALSIAIYLFFVFTLGKIFNYNPLTLLLQLIKQAKKHDI